MKGKIETVLKIFNCDIKAEFDAEIQPDGSMILEFHEALYIPKDKFKLAVLRDMR